MANDAPKGSGGRGRTVGSGARWGGSHGPRALRNFPSSPPMRTRPVSGSAESCGAVFESAPSAVRSRVDRRRLPSFPQRVPFWFTKQPQHHTTLHTTQTHTQKTQEGGMGGKRGGKGRKENHFRCVQARELSPIFHKLDKHLERFHSSLTDTWSME